MGLSTDDYQEAAPVGAFLEPLLLAASGEELAREPLAGLGAEGNFEERTGLLTAGSREALGLDPGFTAGGHDDLDRSW